MKQEPMCDDPYEILGVAPDAMPDEIRAAHRRLVRKFHPDANRNDPATAKRFDAVQQAYRLLNDLDRRGRWDGQRRARADRAAAHSDSGTRAPPSANPSPPTARAATPSAEDASPRHEQAPRGSMHGERENASRFNAPSRDDADDIEIDIDLPIDASWSTAAPPPAKMASAWRATLAPKRWVPRSARAILLLVVIGGGLAGIAMMAMQVMPMIGAIILVAAPVSLYVLERTSVLD